MIPDDRREKVREVRDSAFYLCERLKCITIPESVTYIGYFAVSNCPRLTLRVHEGSHAHRYAMDNNIPCELI